MIIMHFYYLLEKDFISIKILGGLFYLESKMFLLMSWRDWLKNLKSIMKLRDPIWFIQELLWGDNYYYIIEIFFYIHFYKVFDNISS